MTSESDRDRLDSPIRPMFDRYGPDTVIGNKLRTVEALRVLTEMDEAEAAVHSQELIAQSIGNRLERMQAEHELNMQYLIEFGVTANERETFRAILERAAVDGTTTPHQAARIARLKHQNGSSSERGGTSSPSSTTMVS